MSLPYWRAPMIVASIALSLFVTAGLAQAGPSTEPDRVRVSSPGESEYIRSAQAMQRSIGEAEPGADPVPTPEPPLCGVDPSMPVPQMVAHIFRCRLAESGIVGADADYVAAEAVTIAACESNFDTTAVVFDGRYLHRLHPATGSQMSAAGVFQFIRRTADDYIKGGYANVHDPVANIDAAVHLYLDNRSRGVAGWADWACFAANDGFAHASVIPGGPGGPPALPAWAFEL